eukprot:gnl/MRDRNA2_/MRDRNA2_102939_c0_seq1.p1 gnl/MRDRNA2_/MRDRNA2_102939_c0~~gnl/MRDRNA2_/MRDRNA2_102939_c0_seq1.p1  ORF type:complete len:471 (-),score=110.68 gnl/MRDRNA2_/MRDRNA2_102939_c0_seq1:77-1489(-)
MSPEGEEFSLGKGHSASAVGSRLLSQDAMALVFDDLVDEIQKEMMLVMLESVQRAAGICADLCVARLLKEFDHEQSGNKPASEPVKCEIFNIGDGDDQTLVVSSDQDNNHACPSNRPSIESRFEDMTYYQRQSEEDDGGMTAEPAAEPAAEESCGRSSGIANQLVIAADQGLAAGLEPVNLGSGLESETKVSIPEAEQSSSPSKLQCNPDIDGTRQVENPSIARRQTEILQRFSYSGFDTDMPSHPERPHSARHAGAWKRQTEIFSKDSARSKRVSELMDSASASFQRPYVAPLDLRRQSHVTDLLNLAQAAAEEACSSSRSSMTSTQRSSAMGVEDPKELNDDAPPWCSVTESLSKEDWRTLIIQAAQTNDLIRDLMAASEHQNVTKIATGRGRKSQILEENGLSKGKGSEDKGKGSQKGSSKGGKKRGMHPVQEEEDEKKDEEDSKAEVSNTTNSETAGASSWFGGML